MRTKESSKKTPKRGPWWWHPPTAERRLLQERLRIWRRRLYAYITIWGLVPVIWGIWWAMLHVFPGHIQAQSSDQWLMTNVLSTGRAFWVWVTICLALCLVSTLVTAKKEPSDFNNRTRGPSYSTAEWRDERPKPRKVATPTVASLLALGIILSFLQAITISLGVSKEKAKDYNKSIVFYTPSFDPSQVPSLSAVLKGAKSGVGTSCDLIGPGDVPACIKKGTLPTTGWDPRPSSLNGAKNILSTNTATIQNVDLNKDTVTYLAPWHNKLARWSGVLDGKGNGLGMGGVAEWDGQNVTVCPFTGKYAIDRSFAGDQMASLDDLIAEKFPGLEPPNISDVSGYCDGDQPIVLIAMRRLVYYADRTVDVAGGIILVQGDNGKTRLTYHASVAPGEYPAPVYPASLVDAQLNDGVAWAAGRRQHDDFGFGYEPANAAVQFDDVADYLLRDAASGRLEFVTPLTLKGSNSEIFVAYAVSYADEVASGSLNQLSVYVLAQGDSRQIAINTTEQKALDWFNQKEPFFVSNSSSDPGRLLEFTPTGGNMWRAFGERTSGLVEYILDIDATGQTPPHLIDVSGNTESDSPSPCGQAPGALTDQLITSCIQQFIDEQARRQKLPTTK